MNTIEHRDGVPMHLLNDAFNEADALYSQYAKLTELSELALLGNAERVDREIVASVSPVMCEGYANAIVG